MTAREIPQWDGRTWRCSDCLARGDTGGASFEHEGMTDMCPTCGSEDVFKACPCCRDGQLDDGEFWCSNDGDGARMCAYNRARRPPEDHLDADPENDMPPRTRSDMVAAMLNELGATLGFEPGTNREIVVLPALVNFDTVEIGGGRARWSNERERWVPA